ncbi:MAG: thioredoxin family protein [Pseudomonadota bacterium]
MTKHPAIFPAIQRRAFLGTVLALAATQDAVAGTGASPLLRDHGAAPEFTGIEQWLNTSALTLAALRGRVVLVDFWTYSCINCLRTLPHVNRWAETYKSKGLVVVGVHTPEFGYERSVTNVESAMRRFGVRHPVAQDNHYATWKAYSNQYWPAFYLIDGMGRIRYKHFGEGRYQETEEAINQLLALASSP